MTEAEARALEQRASSSCATASSSKSSSDFPSLTSRATKPPPTPRGQDDSARFLFLPFIRAASTFASVRRRPPLRPASLAWALPGLKRVRRFASIPSPVGIGFHGGVQRPVDGFTGLAQREIPGTAVIGRPSRSSPWPDRLALSRPFFQAQTSALDGIRQSPYFRLKAAGISISSTSDIRTSGGNGRRSACRLTGRVRRPRADPPSPRDAGGAVSWVVR